MTDSARRVTVNVEQMTAGVRLEPVVADLRQTTAEAQGADRRPARGRRPASELRSALREVDGLARTTQTFVLDLQGMVERLNRTIDNLEQLTDVLRQQPSHLLFSNPPPPRPAPKR